MVTTASSSEAASHSEVQPGYLQRPRTDSNSRPSDPKFAEGHSGLSAAASLARRLTARGRLLASAVVVDGTSWQLSRAVGQTVAHRGRVGAGGGFWITVAHDPRSPQQPHRFIARKPRDGSLSGACSGVRLLPSFCSAGTVTISRSITKSNAKVVNVESAPRKVADVTLSSFIQ
jgi:hypothetical protein